MKRLSIATLILAVLLSGCATFRETEPLPRTQAVDIDAILGTWFVMGYIPSLRDGDAYNSAHIIRRLDRGFEITYQFNRGGPDGELIAFTTTANILDPGINTQLQVRTTWPFRSTYNIIYMSEDQSAMVIGHPDRTSVWILSRARTIEDAHYSDIILKLQEMNYHIGRIRTVPHQ